MSLAEKIYLKNEVVTRENADKGLKETVDLWIKKAKEINREFKGEKIRKEIECIAVPEPAGLAKNDIEKLKKYKKELNNYVKVYITVELMPFMFLALLISLFLGDLIFIFLYSVLV